MEQRISGNTGLSALARPASGAGGFSLVEIIVSLTILAIGMLGVGALFPLGTATIAKSGAQTAATELAQQGVEELLDLPFDDNLLEAGVAHADSISIGDMTYNRTWQVQDDVPMQGCKLITYTIDWRAGSGRKQYEVSAVIARSGRH